MNLRAALALFLTAALAVAAFLAARHKRAVTMITSVPYVITKPGVYQLGVDLMYPPRNQPTAASGTVMIDIAASNVTLDFQGHSLQGPDDAGTVLTAVHANNQENITIKNGRITRCFMGIFLRGDSSPNWHNSNHRIENMLVTHCYHIGVNLLGARNCEVRDCRITFIGPSRQIAYACGIVASGDGIQLSGNLIADVTPRDGEAFGIVNNGCAGVFAVGNTVTNCQFGIGAGKYLNNLTSGCEKPFFSGIDAGGNR